MSEQKATTAVAGEPAPAPQDGKDGDEALVEEELLVEEVSIDGMCGVY
jgi:mycofactocin precursor